MNKFILVSIIIVFSLFFTPYNVKAQKNDGERENLRVGMAQAWLRFNEEDYRGALRIYRSLYNANSEDATLNFRIGQCYIEINQMDSALTYLDKSILIDSASRNEAYFLVGQAHHYIGNLDKAIENFLIYKSKLKPRQSDRDYVNVLLQQCYTAKELMAKPVDVKITNLGAAINTKYVDASPSVSADGKTLIFTSRRPDNIGGAIDPWTEDYYDDIYISTFDDKNKEWLPAKNIGPPINTEHHDANLSISADGNTIFIYKNIVNVTRSGDIYYSTKRPSGDWNEPRPIDTKNINSSYFESSASLTADGNTLYFVSERPRDGHGQADIFMSKKEGREWSKPVNLGPVINSAYDEIGVFIHPDGKTLFFSSNGHKTMGGYDIFMSVNENGKWAEPINLGYPINTTRNEVHFVMTADRHSAYISSTRDGGFGKFDIYHVDMKNYFSSNKEIPQELAATLTGPPLCILRGTVIDADSSEPLIVDISIKDMTDNTIHKTESTDNGEYFITLPADRRYEVDIKTKGYKPLNVKFRLPKAEGETPTMIKHLLLNKD